MRFGRSFPMPALLRGTPAKRVGIFTDTDVATVTLTASGVEVPPTGATATDTFTRTVTNGWGTADSGQVWAVSQGAAADFSTDGTTGVINIGTSTVAHIMSLPVSVVDDFVTVDASSNTLPTGAGYQFARVFGRYVDSSNFYRMILRHNTDGSVDCQLEKQIAGATTTLAAYSQVLASYTAGTIVHIRFECSGTNPTTINSKVWQGATEPTSWSLSATDNPSSLTAAADIALGAFKIAGVTNSMVSHFDNLSATASTGGGGTTGTTYSDADTGSVVLTAGAAVIPAETQQAVESGQATVTLTASGTDALAVLEPTVQATVTLTASGPDTLQTQDAVTATLSLTPSAVEIPAHFDAATATLSLTPSAVETAQFIDAAMATLSLTPSTLEVPAHFDAATAQVNLTPSTTLETAQFVDAAQAAISLTPSAVETAQFVDAATANLALTASASVEGIFTTDAATANVVLSQPTVVEQAQFVDTTTVTLVLSPTAVEIPAHYDADVASVTVTAVTTQEGAVFVESFTANVTLTPSAADIAQYTDAAQAAVQVLASAVDVAQFVDTLRPTLTLTASAVEAAQFVESATANVVTTASAIAEGMVFIDSATGSVSLTASAVDIALRVDAATANVVLTGSATEFREVLDADTAFVNTTASAVTEGIVAEIFVVITPSGVEQYTPNDQDTAIVDLSNVTGVEVVALSSQDTAFVFTTAFSPDVSAFIDAGTATVNLLPSEITERRNIFDTNLIATVNARYSATELAPHIVGTLGSPHIVGTATARYVGAFEGLVPLVS